MPTTDNADRARRRRRQRGQARRLRPRRRARRLEAGQRAESADRGRGRRRPARQVPDPGAGRLAAQAEDEDRLERSGKRDRRPRYSVSVDDEPIGKRTKRLQAFVKRGQDRRRPPPSPDLRRSTNPGRKRAAATARYWSTRKPPQLSLETHGRRATLRISDGPARSPPASRRKEVKVSFGDGSGGGHGHKGGGGNGGGGGSKGGSVISRSKGKGGGGPIVLRHRFAAPGVYRIHVSVKRPGGERRIAVAEGAGRVSARRRIAALAFAAAALGAASCTASAGAAYDNGFDRVPGAFLVSADYAHLEQGDDTTKFAAISAERALRRDRNLRPQLLRRRRSRPAGRVPGGGHLPLRPAGQERWRKSPTATSSTKKPTTSSGAAPPTPRSAPTGATSPSPPPSGWSRPTRTKTSTSTCGT